jgi:hypothetical protein
LGQQLDSLGDSERWDLINGLAYRLGNRSVAPQEVMNFLHLTDREKVWLLSHNSVLTEQGKKDLTRGVMKKIREITEEKPHTFALSLNQYTKRSVQTLEAYADGKLTEQQITHFCKTEDIIPFNSPDVSSDDVLALSIEMFRAIQKEQAMIDLEIYQEEEVELNGAAQVAADIFTQSLLSVIMDVHNACRH